jgi:RNA ligase (TIGR02306 family)
MSTFKVSLEIIDTVTKHPNADKLDIATLEGMSFEFVVGRDQYKKGDRVIYFPVDSLMPEDILEAIGLTGKLSGSKKNRIRTIKLRGVFSQGLVASPSLLFPTTDFSLIMPGDDLTCLCAVTKYEAPQPGEPHIQGAPREKTLPDNVSHYDIEGCDRYKKLVEEMLDWPVLVTEKLEGSHTAITRYPDGKIIVCSRNHALQMPDDLSTCRWHLGCKNSGLFRAINELQNNAFQGKQVTIRGELLGPGVQDNIYKLTDYKVVAFEIEVDGKPLSGQDFLKCCFKVGIDNAPILNNIPDSWRAPQFAMFPTLREHLEGKTTAQASNGPSTYRPEQLREGIVIRPWLEEHNCLNVRGVGRPILKHRSPEYLTKSEL